MRRSLLLALLLLAGCASAPHAPHSTPLEQPPAETAVPAEADRAGLRAGPMLGYATHRDATVWVQTDGPAEVRLRYRAVGRTEAATTEPADTAAALTPPMPTTTAGDFIAEFVLGGLAPGTRYAYEILLDGVPVPRPYPTELVTQPLWQWRTDPPDFTVAFGSCAYVNDPPFDRPGDPYGGGYAIFESIRALRPDLMLWLGDNVYLREVDWWSEAGIRYRYAHTRALPELQALLAAQPHLAIWDDHDYGPNNSDRSYVLKGEALEVFEDYWANPSYGLPGVPGVFTHAQWADVEFFLLDNRYHRSPENAPRTPEKTQLGEAQLQWLIDALHTSTAPFKVVAMGGQFLNPYDFYETYGKYPHERQRILDALVERGIPGVVFLSGDRHHTELLRLDVDGFYPIYDFTSSPLTAGPANPARELENPLRVEGTLVRQQRNFGTLSFSGPRTDRVLTMRTYDTNGTLLWEHIVRARDLVVPEPE